MQGKIIKGIGGFYYVHCPDGQIYECRAKGIFRKDRRKPLVGDNVEITVLDPGTKEGNVTALLPRKNSLIRPAVANADQALVLFAASSPKPNFLLLDRFLVMMEQQGVPSVICFNKMDLASEEECLCLKKIYEKSGYPVLFISVQKQEGIPEIRRQLEEKTTVVAGPSGVGKSSLTNLLQEEVRMETGEISTKLGRGKHTTRHSQIIPVNTHTYLVDTPGFTSLYLPEMEEEKLKDFFREFEPYEGQCRFLGCRHIREPECAVKEALKLGKFSSQRYENYLALHEELKEIEKRRYS